MGSVVTDDAEAVVSYLRRQGKRSGGLHQAALPFPEADLVRVLKGKKR